MQHIHALILINLNAQLLEVLVFELLDFFFLLSDVLLAQGPVDVVELLLHLLRRYLSLLVLVQLARVRVLRLAVVLALFVLSHLLVLNCVLL